MEVKELLHSLKLRPMELKAITPGESGAISTFQIVLLGVGLALGGHAIAWNQILTVGTQQAVVETVVYALAYLFICSALAEMTSGLPFGGGLYGFIRVTMGPYVGFIVGCCEMVQNCVNASLSLHWTGIFVAQIFHLSTNFAPIVWLIVLTAMVGVNLMGTGTFWRANTILVLMCFVLLLLFYAIAMPCIDCAEHGGGGFTTTDMNHATFQWFKYMAFPSFFYTGVEMLPMACADAKDPKRSLPSAIHFAMGFLFVNSILLIITVGCTAPGAYLHASDEAPPAASLFASKLHMTDSLARALSVPFLCCSTNCFLFIYAKQLRSMAESGLFPSFLKSQYGPDRIPYAALIHGAVIIFLIAILAGVIDYIILVAAVLIGGHATIILDVCILVSYEIFRRKFAGLPRYFHNPFGLFGTVYGIFIIVGAMICVAILYPNGYIGPILAALFLMITSVYYSFRVKPRQGFSDEEQRVMFTAYVINANRRAKNKQRRKGKDDAEKSIHGAISSAIMGARSPCGSNSYRGRPGRSAQSSPNPSRQSPQSSEASVHLTASPRTVSTSSRPAYSIHSNKAVFPAYEVHSLTALGKVRGEGCVEDSEVENDCVDDTELRKLKGGAPRTSATFLLDTSIVNASACAEHTTSDEVELFRSTAEDSHPSHGRRSSPRAVAGAAAIAGNARGRYVAGNTSDDSKSENDEGNDADEQAQKKGRRVDSMLARAGSDLSVHSIDNAEEDHKRSLPMEVEEMAMSSTTQRSLSVGRASRKVHPQEPEEKETANPVQPFSATRQSRPLVNTMTTTPTTALDPAPPLQRTSSNWRNSVGNLLNEGKQFLATLVPEFLRTDDNFPVVTDQLDAATVPRNERRAVREEGSVSLTQKIRDEGEEERILHNASSRNSGKRGIARDDR